MLKYCTPYCTAWLNIYYYHHHYVKVTNICYICFCVFRKVLADVGWEPVRGEGSLPDFCFTWWMTRQMAAIPFSTLISVDTVLSLDSQRPESILTEHCWDSLLALRSDQRCKRLYPIKACVKVIPKKPSSPCCGSLPNSLREHLKFHMRKSELNSDLFPQRKK